MKSLITLQIISCLVSATDYHHLVSHHNFDLEEFLQGFFKGAFDYQGMHHTAHCGEHGGSFEHNMDNVLAGFWVGTYAKVNQAVADFGFMIADIGQMLFDCAKIDHFDFEQVNKMSESFLHPKSILLDGTEYLMVNGMNLYEDVRDGLISHRLGQSYEYGLYLGHAGALSLYGKTQLNITEINYEFGKHWLEWAAVIQEDKARHLHHIEAMKDSLHQFEFIRLNQLLDGLLFGSLGAEQPHAGNCLRHPRHTW